jgi:predicted esterase
LVKFDGKLLLIHGEQDEVIKVTHGKNLAHIYETENQYNKLATKVYPRRMTHNSFDIKKDIIAPILQFLKSEHNIST